MICKPILKIIFLNKPELIFFFCTQLNGFNNCYQELITLFNIDHLFAYSEVVSNINSHIFTLLNDSKYGYAIPVIKFLNLVKRIQVLLSNTNNSIQIIHLFGLVWFLCLMAYQPL